ncbi:protein SRC2-like [Musa acuminata AAA Group]|uniref:protein SRC2-like n=1 Tax=Musa acuminata AAA Group TaxID=214697 RepID=UPI0031DF5F04
MACRTLEITLVSAKGLKDVNLISKMAVYAVVSLSGKRRGRQLTPPDREGGRNPTWNSTIRLTVPVDVDLARHSIHILLRTKRALRDRDVGEVRVPLSDLLSGACGGPPPIQFVSYQVHRVTSGKPNGVLNFSYKPGECVAAFALVPSASAYPPPFMAHPTAPVMLYPAGTSSAAYTAYGAGLPYPPPVVYQQLPPLSYGHPPVGYGYGYSPASYGYGYGAAPPPVVQPHRKKILGTGQLGGALGGLLVGDMISDAAAYDAGL